MYQKGNKIVCVGNLQEHPYKIDGHYIFDDAFVTEYDKVLYDSEGNEYNVLNFEQIEDHVLLYPRITERVNGWRHVKRSCVKLDRKPKIGDLLYTKKFVNNKKMKAIEARQIAVHFNTNETNSQYADIIKKIEIAAKKGEFNMYWYTSFNTGVKQKLIDNGYTVGNTNHDQRDGYSTQISW